MSASVHPAVPRSRQTPTVRSGTTPPYRSLLRELFWTRTGLLVAVTALTGLGLLVFSASLPPDSLASRIWFALGTGLAAAALFTTAQTVIAADAANRLLVDALARQTQQAMRQLTDEYRAMDLTYLPTHVFESSPRPDPTFNRQLTRDLEASRMYLFRGLSGRHTAARLLTARPRNWEVRVVIADLRASESLRERARYLVGAGYGTSLEKTYAEVRQQVRAGLVGLYLARLRCSRISITVSHSPSLDRFEIFDDSVWVTLYSDISRPAALYPRSLRFGRDSFIYTMQRRDFERTTDEAPTELIDPGMAGREFSAMFERLTGDRLTSRELATLQGEFDRFRYRFVTDARLDQPPIPEQVQLDA